jgi:NADH-quinone oxidoreductase subunit G
VHSDLARQPVPRSWSLGEHEIVTITIDGQKLRAPKGMLLIEAAERNGIHIPRFCWHNRMQPVAMCRMCLVEVDGIRGIPPACTTPIADGMVAHTQTPVVKKAQDGLLEFLLINHPLDCPVCDRGGECPLQDQTLVFGPGESRFVEEKRHFEKPIPISELVMLDRERCVLCARCTRFTEEISGDPLIDFVERGNQTQVLTFPDEPFRSYFSGNTVQICPVGALTATPYRFRARPWDLEESESTCTLCAVGCRMTVESSSDRVLRHLGVDSEAVNQSWLCDKGRFGFEVLSSPERLTVPLVRKDGTLRESTWPEALDVVAARLREASGRIGILGGARGTNESAYVLARFAREVCRTSHIDAQLGDGLPAELVAGIAPEKRGTIADLESASCVVVVGPDLKEELPVLFLRVRRAVTALGATLVEIHPRDTGLSRIAHCRLRPRPGEAADLLSRLAADVAVGAPGEKDFAPAHAALRGGRTLIIVGQSNLAEDPQPAAAAAVALAGSLPDARVLPVLRRGNVHGAIDAGCAPGLLPGRVLAEVGEPGLDGPGLDASGILRALASGELDVLLMVGSDPLADFPDPALAEQALTECPFAIAIDLFLTESARQAEVVLPAAGYAEQDGTVTNLEGRVTRISSRVTPPGIALADWEILTDLAARLGTDLGLDSPGAIAERMAQDMPAWEALRPERLHRPREPDGTLAGPGPARFDASFDPSIPPVDAYGVRIVTSRYLYDHGEMVSRCPSLAPLAPPPRAALHPREGSRLGLSDGDPVVVRNGKGSVTLPIQLDPGTPEGVIFIPFPTSRPLITADDRITEARLETRR